MINFALYLNETSLLLEDALTQLQYNAEELDFNFFLFAEQRKFDNWFPVFDNSINLDGILVLGGDGTILRAVKYSLKYKSPLLGINLGHLGFLTETTLFELKKSLNYIKEKRYKILSRMMLKVNVKKKHGSQSTHLALNDVVLSKGESPKLINLKFYNNRRYVFSTRCDGMIVASPTGSTAYSLSAGGPIISPVMDALVVVPITPHVLTVRPMVFPSSDIITILIEGQNENCCLQIDGCNYENLSQEDKLQISSANEKVDFIKLSNRTFYKILRQKMHLGKR